MLFWTILGWFLTLVFASLSGYVGYKAYQWGSAVLALEEDIEEAIEALDQTEKSMNRVLTMQLFFDAPEVKAAVGQIMDEVKMSKFRINALALRLTERSKLKFTFIVDDGAPEENADEQFLEIVGKKALSSSNSSNTEDSPSSSVNRSQLSTRGSIVARSR